MTEFIRKRAANAKDDILSGITVALALVPEAVAFAFVAGVDPFSSTDAAQFSGSADDISGLIRSSEIPGSVSLRIQLLEYKT